MILETILAFCLNTQLPKIPTLDGGRIKPFISLASESVDFLKIHKGKESEKWAHFDKAQLYCHLYFSPELQNKVETPIQNEKLKNFLQLGEHPAISYAKLSQGSEDIRREYFRQKVSDGYKKSLESLLHQVELYQKITQGEHWKVFTPEETWVMAKEVPMAQILESKTLYDSRHPEDSYSLEVYYLNYKPFLISLVFSILALFSYLLFPGSWPGALSLGASVTLQAMGLIFRMLISHRAPITNMYETVLFSGYGGLILSIIIFFLKKETLYIIVGLIYNICCLLMLHLAHGMLDPNIHPLVPVLRDNFWLSTHVTTVILSYAAFALTWVLSNMAIVTSFFSKKKEKDFWSFYGNHIYTGIKFGVFFLATGIILGGVWADYSWGRFWGWDPKETWSLIVLLIYMAILHAKYTNWLPMRSFVFYSATAFLGVMMAWFGVNYILASGLHSYGFSQNGALFLGSFFALQLFLIGLGLLSPKFFSKA